MPRPKGYRMSQEAKERIGEANRRAWVERRPWVEVSNSIIHAFEDGDEERALELYHNFMAARSVERTAIMNQSAPKYKNARAVKKGRAK